MLPVAYTVVRSVFFDGFSPHLCGFGQSVFIAARLNITGEINEDSDLEIAEVLIASPRKAVWR